jgi:hypothetical protein
MSLRDERAAVARGEQAGEIPAVRRHRGMLTLTLVLAANVPQSIGIEGDYFHVLTAPVDDLKVRFDEDRQMSAYAGVGFRRYYERVEFLSATGQTVEVMMGFGSVADARATSNVNVTTNIAPGNTLNDGGDVSCVAGAATQLLALDADRLYAEISNPSSNTHSMRIGSAAVTATSGMLLEPGQTKPVATTAAIFAWNTGGTDETLVVGVVREV